METRGIRGRRTRLVGAVVMAAVAGGCASESPGLGPSPAAAPAPVAAHDVSYDVYRAVLAWGQSSAGVLPIVVVEETKRSPGCGGALVDGVREEWAAAIDSFHSENAFSGRIAEGQPLGLPYAVVPGRDIDAIFAAVPGDLNRGWQLFREVYPPGVLVTLSKVGFNRERTRAVVHVTIACGSLCMTSRDYYVEQRAAGTWVVTPAFSCWLVA